MAEREPASLLTVAMKDVTLSAKEMWKAVAAHSPHD
jgi:hypothetical protein